MGKIEVTFDKNLMKNIWKKNGHFIKKQFFLSFVQLFKAFKG